MRSISLLPFFFLFTIQIKAQFSAKDVDSLKKVIESNRNEDTLKVIAIVSLGSALMYSDNRQALEYTGQGLRLSEKLKWERGIKSAYRQYGAIYMAMSDFYNALDYNYKAINANKSNNAKFNAEMEMNQAGIYLGLEDYRQALSSYYSALYLFRREKLHYQTAICLLNMGTAYLRQRILPDSSIYYFQESFTIAEKNNFLVIELYTQSNLGAVYNMIKRFNEAKNLFSNLVESKSGKENISIYGQSVAGLAEAYFGLNEIDSAEKFSIQALDILKPLGTLENQPGLYLMLSDLYKKSQKWEKAFDAYKNSILIRDSIASVDKKSEAGRLQAQFEYKKKEAVLDATHQAEINQQKTVKNAIASGAGILAIGGIISFLFYKRKRDAVAKKNEAEFKTEVTDTEMKALRAQMNPHFIFNSLNSISDYIAKNDVEEADRYLGKFAKLMRMILENSEQKEVSLADDLKALELYMQLEALRMNNKFSYEIIVDDQVDKESTMVPPLLLQPFVENSIWHGIAQKEGPGKILIHIKMEGDQMINCIVEDNGIGRQQSTQIKTTIPPQEKTSLGMKITQARIDILNKLKNSNAVVELSDLAQGMRVEVKLPLATNF